MKTNLIAVTLLLLAALATAHAQTTTTTPPPVNPQALDEPATDGRRLAKRDWRRPTRSWTWTREGSGLKGRLRKIDRKSAPDGREHGLTSLSTVTGTVGELTGNDDFILNGFTLSVNSAPAMMVQFPAHLGQQVQKAVKAGSTVSVTGFSDKSPDGDTRFHMTSLTAGKTTVVDAPPAMPATPPAAPTLTTTTGKITDYKLDRKGRVMGLEINDNTIIRIPPHIAYQLTNLAKKGTEITVQGYANQPREGQVQLQKVNILRASVLTINGQQYLVR